MSKPEMIDPRDRALDQIVQQTGLTRDEVEARFASGFLFAHDGQSAHWIRRAE